jgi:tRNA nucleotidyltransferase/poly(A) polymerase
LGRKITTITGLASKRPDILAEVKTRLQQEMKKLTEAKEWAQQYRAGADPHVPKWAKGYEGQLHGPDIIEDEA